MGLWKDSTCPINLVKMEKKILKSIKNVLAYKPADQDRFSKESQEK
jgi:hypothetical protein